MSIVRIPLPPRSGVVGIDCMTSGRGVVSEFKVHPGRCTSPALAHAMGDVWQRIPDLQAEPGPFCIFVLVASVEDADESVVLLWRDGLGWRKLCRVFARDLAGMRDLARRAAVAPPEVEHESSATALRVAADLGHFMARVERIIGTSLGSNP